MKKALPLGLLAIVLLLGLAGVALFLAQTGLSTAAWPTPGPDEVDACLIAEQILLDRLTTPASAGFARCPGPDAHIRHDGDEWTVRSHVDAHNEHGALVRYYTQVKMRHDPATGNWRALDVEIAGR